MSGIQRLFMRILPERWAQDMERDSRRWTFRCDTCGLERSVWDIGGIRWKATGNSRTLLRCPQCGKTRVHSLYRRDEPAED